MGARSKRRNGEGFTLIELMVVVLILGILMAIAIPTFLSLTSSAKKTAAQADLSTALTDAATYFTANGTYGANVKEAVANFEAADANIVWVTYSGGRIGIVTPLGPANADLSARLPVSIGLDPKPVLQGRAEAGEKEVLVSEPTYRIKGAVAGTVIDLGVLDKNGKYYWAQDNAGTVTYANATTSPTVPRKFGRNSLP